MEKNKIELWGWGVVYGCMATEEKEKKGKNLFTKDEVVNILMDKKNWAEAAHQGLNYALEKNPLNKIPGAAGMAKIAGPPLKLAQTAAEVGWALATPKNRANNKKDMEDLADTSVMNRLASGWLSTGANFAGAGQLLKEMDNSLRAESEARSAESEAFANQADRLVWEARQASKSRDVDNKKRELFMNDVFAKRDAAERERVLIAEEERRKMIEPDPREEAAKIARAIRQQKELAGGS